MSTKKEKAKFVVEALEALYPETPIPLDHKDPYTLLIAVLLSAQCTDARVNTVTPHLFALADNPFDMAQQPVERIQAIIRPCGLSPKKAAAISTLSQMLIEKYQGEVPKTYEALEALPGVGHKTAMTALFTVGVAQTFYFNRRWTFVSDSSSWVAFRKYLLIYSAAWLINLFALILFVDELGFAHELVQGAAVMGIAISLFMLQKFWVFPNGRV
jgi:putative flippase GtrA